MKKIFIILFFLFNSNSFSGEYDPFLYLNGINYNYFNSFCYQGKNGIKKSIMTNLFLDHLKRPIPKCTYIFDNQGNILQIDSGMISQEGKEYFMTDIFKYNNKKTYY